MLAAADRAKVLAGQLKATQAAMAKAVALSDVKAVARLSGEYHQLRAALDTVEPALREQQAAAKAAAEALKQDREEAKRAAKEIANAFSEAAKKAEELRRNSAIALGVIGAGAVVAGAALYEGAKFALEASENVKVLTSQFDALGGEGFGGQALTALRQLEKEVPQSEAQLSAWARTLAGAGVTDLGQLQEQLKAISTSEAMVEGGGEHVKNLFAKLAEQSMKGGGKVKFSLASLAGTGVGEEEFLHALGMTPAAFAAAKKSGALTGAQVADAISSSLAAKGGKALDAQMNTLAAVETKAYDAAKRLFEGVDTEPLVNVVKAMGSFFDDSTNSGKVMKETITTAFNAIFKIAEKVFIFLGRGFLRLIIVFLQTKIWIDHNKTAFQALAAVVVGAMVGGVVALTVATWGYVAAAGAAAVAVIAATWPFLAIGAAIGLVIFGIYELIKHWDDVVNFFKDMARSALEAGANFVQGIVDGIRNGIGRAIQAAKDLGTSVLHSVANVLKLGSPSRLMFEYGVNTAAGLEGGIGAGQGGVADASEGLGRAAGSLGGGGGSGRSVTVQFGDITIVLHAPDSASREEVLGVVEEGLAALGERLALMIGAAP